MEMCNQNTTTDTLQALVSDSSVAQQHSRCVCSVKQTSYDFVTITVKYFNCDTDSCPWKLKFYEDGCLREEFCCGQTPQDFSYKIHTSGHFLIAYEAQSGSSTYSSSVRINIIGSEWISYCATISLSNQFILL